MRGYAMPGSGGKVDRNTWFEQRRDHFVRQVVDDFFLLVRSFEQLYGVYLDCRNTQANVDVDFFSPETEQARGRIWNRLTQMIGTEAEKGRLWLLKDLCHQVWPEQKWQHEVQGALFDWLLGSVFHEVMKLKENVYLLNTYGPAAVRTSDVPSSSSGQVLQASGSFPHLSSMVDAEGIIRRIATDVVTQVEQVGFFLGQANFILRMMMPDMGSNMLVVRLLVEKEELVQSLWGESVEELFTDMFFGNAAEGFCAAGQSYLLGQWYVQALAMYERALQSDRKCDKAHAKVVHLKAVLQENQGLQSWRSRGESALLV